MKLFIMALIIVITALAVADTDDDDEIWTIDDIEIQIKPLPPIAPIPPLGTEKCVQQYLCKQNGECKWVTICQ